ncbi:hypothetical protein RB195_002352 [Necator americanus]|uniref:Uncharacterized protein n=1 Tax=Necator americanus TaxID=51031 RepID=A0ABR1DK44_NECAM
MVKAVDCEIIPLWIAMGALITVIFSTMNVTCGKRKSKEEVSEVTESETDEDAKSPEKISLAEKSLDELKAMCRCTPKPLPVLRYRRTGKPPILYYARSGSSGNENKSLSSTLDENKPEQKSRTHWFYASKSSTKNARIQGQESMALDKSQEEPVRLSEERCISFKQPKKKRIVGARDPQYMTLAELNPDCYFEYPKSKQAVGDDF